MSGTLVVDITEGGRVVLASSGNNLGMLLNILKHTRQPLTHPKNYPAQNVNNDEKEKLRYCE